MPDLSLLTTFLSDHKGAIGWLALVSGVLFVGCLVVVPWLVVRVPADYFISPRRPKTPFTDRHPILRLAGLILKNVTGLVLIAAGIAMLLLPGQGILTIVMGVLLMDFPGKHRLESRIIRWGPVLKSINWLRRRSDVPPIKVTATQGDDGAETAGDVRPTRSEDSERPTSVSQPD